MHLIQRHATRPLSANRKCQSDMLINGVKQGLQELQSPRKLLKNWNLRLVGHISVVTLSVALNLVSLKSLCISLSNDVPFVTIMHLCGDQQT